MIINKLKVLEEHWELVANNTRPRKRREGRRDRMVGWMERKGRMGNHYANEAGLNHTVPMIICWEEPRLRGSLVCSMAGTLFLCVFSFLTLVLFPILQFSHFFSSPPSLKLPSLVCACGVGFRVMGMHKYIWS